MSPKKVRIQEDRLRILVANGVNLDLLGRREPSIYGHTSLADLEEMLRREVRDLARWTGLPQVDLVFIQSNVEGEFLNSLTAEYDGILINPGAWTHTSLALADRLKGLEVPYVEVHISNVYSREPVRHKSYIALAAEGGVYGFGLGSYQVGLLGLLMSIRKRHEAMS